MRYLYNQRRHDAYSSGSEGVDTHPSYSYTRHTYSLMLQWCWSFLTYSEDNWYLLVRGILVWCLTNSSTAASGFWAHPGPGPDSSVFLWSPMVNERARALFPDIQVGCHNSTMGCDSASVLLGAPVVELCIVASCVTVSDGRYLFTSVAILF